MKTAKHQAILIVEPDAQFREELYNFLLAAGYETVTAIDTLATVLDNTCLSAYDVVLADAGSPWGNELQLAKDLGKLNVKTKIILMIEAKDQEVWNQIAAQVVGASFLIKNTFARNLLYLLMNRA
ncbi:MAG TPA: response regulator [Candidatus Binatia bacterium]|nr:response regulator [Candidatus Binatia bacterium]